MSYLFDCYAGVYDYFMNIFHLQDTKELLQLLPASPKRILDVGGGTGVCADQLYQLAHDVVLLDASAAMLKQAKKRNPNLTLMQSKFVKDLPIGKFDIILCRDCFHHLQDPQDVLSTMLSYLKKDGIIYIHDFHPSYWQVKLLFLFERCCFEHIRPISVEKLTRIASKTGCTYTLHLNHRRDYICSIQRNT